MGSSSRVLLYRCTATGAVPALGGCTQHACMASRSRRGACCACVYVHTRTQQARTPPPPPPRPPPPPPPPPPPRPPPPPPHSPSTSRSSRLQGRTWAASTTCATWRTPTGWSRPLRQPRRRAARCGPRVCGGGAGFGDAPGTPMQRLRSGTGVRCAGGRRNCCRCLGLCFRYCVLGISRLGASYAS